MKVYPPSESASPERASVPPAPERYAAYRKILASPQDGEVDWWYFGTTVVTMAGVPAITVIKAATLMIYRTETLSEDRFAIHWDEVGCFSDYITDQPLGRWLNPVTGRYVDAPQSFAEGPARYEIARALDGVTVSLTQPGAAVSSIDVEWRSAGDRLILVQRERKTRGFPDVNGLLPDPASASGFEAVTELAFTHAWPESDIEVQGLYEFSLSGAPPWMGFEPASNAQASVRGVIIKAGTDRAPNVAALRRLRELYPEFFERHGR